MPAPWSSVRGRSLTAMPARRSAGRTKRCESGRLAVWRPAAMLSPLRHGAVAARVGDAQVEGYRAGLLGQRRRLLRRTAVDRKDDRRAGDAAVGRQAHIDRIEAGVL